MEGTPPIVPGPTPPVEDLDRRLRWRVVPVVVFVAWMAGLAVMAFGALVPPVPTTGLPDEPALLEARGHVAGAAFPTAPYLVHSEFFGPPAAPPADPARLESADSLLHLALARRPLDARVYAALAGVELARRRLRHAETGFRRACDLAGHYPDARIGLAVALAIRADRSEDLFEQRRLRLRAMAQLLDVRPGHPGERAALYDLGLLAAAVDRPAEARAAWERLDAIAPGSAEALDLERRLGARLPRR